ncbi:MAG TPA: tetratricopeptide repeat protein [Ideonella sp.]|nr:tetratricopeptide repeat protein [Ideonella sp.]
MTPPHARPAAHAADAAPPWRGARSTLLALALSTALAAAAQAPSVPDAPPAAPALAASAPGTPASAPDNSSLDAPMFYQLLVGEMEAEAGRADNAFEVMLDAARRSRDPALFQRAIELAVKGRSGERALAGVRAWRSTLPESTEAIRTEVQLLVALDRPADVAEPLRLLIQQVPAADRAAVIAGVPRFFAEMADKPKALAAAEAALAPYLDEATTRTAAHTALGRLALAAGNPARALELLSRASAQDPAAPGPVLLALELMPSQPAAEQVVQAYLARGDALAPVRLAYVRTLDQRQRIGEAVAQLRLALAQQPELAQGWLSLGAYLVDLREPREAVTALNRFLALNSAAQPPATAAHADPAKTDDGDDEPASAQNANDLAYELLANAYEQLGDDKATAQALAKIDSSRIDLAYLVRKAGLMARQGQLKQARELVRTGTARDDPTPRARLLAEAQLLRDRKLWAEAYELLLGGVRQNPDDTVLMYELAMVAERLARYDDMEALLRRVITLKPDDQHAHNALGYSLAERNIRLEEAKVLVQKAAALSPTDPFIADSLGWVEYKLGNRDEALRLLRQALAARPHVEVAAHLGEVLWSMGERDEALRVWREGRAREADNEVLRETLKRLKVSL